MDRFSQASHWHLRQTNGEVLSAEARIQFEEWLADPDNRKEYDAFCEMHQMLGETPVFSTEEINAVLTQDTRKQVAQFSAYRLPALVLSAAAVLCLCLVTWWLFAQEAVVYETAAGEQRTVQLEDGSIVHLDSRTRFEVNYSKGERRLDDFYGRAIFEVEGNPQRPFIIHSGDARVRVVGTVFEVDHPVEADSGRLHVVEGVVEMSVSKNATAPVSMSAGQFLVFREGVISETGHYETAQLGKWRSGRIEFNNWTIREVVREVERYYTGEIICAESVPETLQVTGSFDTNKPLSFVMALEEILPVTVVKRYPDFIEIEGRNRSL